MVRHAAALLVSTLIWSLLSGCAGTTWTDEPTGTWYPPAFDRNVRLCIERGMVFDHLKMECVQP